MEQRLKFIARRIVYDSFLSTDRVTTEVEINPQSREIVDWYYEKKDIDNPNKMRYRRIIVDGLDIFNSSDMPCTIGNPFYGSYTLFSSYMCIRVSPVIMTLVNLVEDEIILVKSRQKNETLKQIEKSLDMIAKYVVAISDKLALANDIKDGTILQKD